MASRKKGGAGHHQALPRNVKGGIEFDAHSLDPAWAMLGSDCPPKADGSIHHISAGKIRQLMSVVYPSITLKEVEWLLGHRESVSFDQLLDLMKDNMLEEQIDPVKEAFIHLTEDGEDTIKLDKVLDIFDEIGVTGLNRKVIDSVFDEVLKTESVMTITWQQAVEQSVMSRIDEWMDMREFRRRRFADLLIFKDKDNMEFCSGSKIPKEDDSVYDYTIQERDMEGDGRLVYKLEMEPSDRFPIKIYVAKPYVIPDGTNEFVRSNREIDLHLFRQMVSYGQDNDEYADAGALSSGGARKNAASMASI